MMSNCKKYFKKIAIFLMATFFVLIIVYFVFSFWFYGDTKNQSTIIINSSTEDKELIHKVDVIEQDASNNSNKQKQDNFIANSSANQKKIKPVHIPTDNQQTLNKIDDNFSTDWKEVVDYVNLKDSVYDEGTKSEIEKGIENLKRYGSISGGIKTNEFADAEASVATLQVQGKNKILDALSFKPYLASTIFNDFELRGADVGGRYSDKGFDSLYTYYENSQGARIALSETQLKTDASKMQVIKETLNTSIQGVPMTWQTIENGDIYSVRFVSGQRHYNISTQGIEKPEALNFVKRIIKKNAS